MKINNPTTAFKEKQNRKNVSKILELSQYYRTQIYKNISIPSKYLGNESK